MEVSRRGHVNRDQRGDDEYICQRRDHRDREPRRARSRSTERPAKHYADETRGRRDGERPERRAYRTHSRDTHHRRSHASRSKDRSPRPEHNEAGRRGSESRHDIRSPRSRPRRERDKSSGSAHRDFAESEPLRPTERTHHSTLELFPQSSHRHRRHTSHRSRSRERPSHRRYHSRQDYISPSPPRESRREHSRERRWTRAEIEHYYRTEDTAKRRSRRESSRDRGGEYEDKRWHRASGEFASRSHDSSRRRPSRPRAYDYPDHHTHHPRHSANRLDDRMEGTRPIQSVMDEREPRGQRIPSFEGSHRGRGRGRGGFENSRGRGNYHGNGPPPPHIDTRHQYPSNPHYGTPAGSYHGSPHSASSYGQHSGWQTPQHYYNAPPAHAYAPPQSRQSSYPPPQSPYYTQHPHQYSPPQVHTPTYAPPAFRGSHGPPRGGSYPPPQQDRRFSGGSVAGSPPQTAAQPSSRGGRGHFQNLRWTAGGGSQSGKGPDPSATSSQGSREASMQPTAPPPPPPAPNDPAPPPPDEDNPFRPSKAFRVEDDSTKSEIQEVKEQTQTPKKPGVSFAFKSKAAPPSAAKPVTDLTQKMKEPPAAPRRDAPTESIKKPAPHVRDPPSAVPTKPGAERKEAIVSRDPRDRFADQRLQREAEAERYKAERLAAAKTKQPERPQRETDRREVERLKPKPQLLKVKQKRKRAKPRPQLAAELKSSKSVYYRKQGNESVVGSGTYGKVYKALHVYTGALVALKKIRMEGEKDGFPVTAVREIKLLQSLRHNNVVKLQEVMVENNDCYMVFEYLSHDLTGLLNHPTFKLEHAHKKDLAMQLFQSLDYLHRRGVLHRDLKAANILVSSNGQLKLADFGLARFYSKHHTLDYTNRVITIWYRPPELLLGETQYGPAVDIWSAACVLVEIFTKHAIFPGDGGEINQLEKIYNVLGTPTRNDWPGLADMAWFELLRPAERRRNVFREKYAERISEQAFELLCAMFQYNPAKRPTAEEVLEHPYFKTESPAPQQVTELANVDGDWHEFESKALRKENERKARKVAEVEREKAKRRASSIVSDTPRDAKRVKSENMSGDTDMAALSMTDNAPDTETAMAGLEPNMQPS